MYQNSIAQKLLTWFNEFGRKNLPWQVKPINPYFVWLSEIMLQQTQVVTVIDYFNNFINYFPTLDTLANASEDEVLAQWAGLGYYARARNLHKTANIITKDYQGIFPQDFKQVFELPGIGKSTAGAILSLSFNQNHPILDGNVKRVLSRYHRVKGHYGEKTTLNQLWELTKYHTPAKQNADYTQAIMDLGAMVCVRVQPKCDKCPIAKDCQAKKHHTQSQYPSQKPIKHKPTKSIAMLIFRNTNQEIYLQKRPTKGIWGGLWSFIECENSSLIIKRNIKKFDELAIIEQKLPPFKHSFTHYNLLIYPIIIACQNNKTFYNINKIQLGVPAPVRQIIQQLCCNDSI